MKVTLVCLPSSASRAASLFIISLGAVVLSASDAAGDDSIALGQVLNAWRNREQRAERFRFRWTKEHFQAKGTLELPPDLKRIGVAFPPRDMTYRVKSSCETVRYLMHYEFSGESLQVYNDGALEHREYLSTSDGVVSRAFWPIPNKRRAYPKGITFEDKICSDASALEVKPLMWIYRALDPRFAFFEGSLRLAPNDEAIGDIKCMVVYSEKDGLQYSVWTDPTRDFVPPRVSIRLPVTGEITTRTDIAYRKLPSFG